MIHCAIGIGDSEASLEAQGDELYMINYLNAHGAEFDTLMRALMEDMIAAPSTQVGEWQSQKIEQSMRELLNVSFNWLLPEDAEELGKQTGARLPWAEDHFQERVSGEPLNPAPSEAWWPFRQNGNAAHKSEGEKFSHTYPERMWPKYADGYRGGHMGIRFAYGDLQDVVNQLIKSPMTRQAFLPIWFPEDTGAVHGKRVPCTLGYHFQIRQGKLTITYYMRSTDLLRHFQDDVYMAGRLAQWVRDRINDATGYEENPYPLIVGEIIFHTANLHVFESDIDIIKYRLSQGMILR